MLRQLLHVLWGRVGMAACRVVALMILAHQLPPAELGRFSFLVIVFVATKALTSLGIAVAGPVMVAEEGAQGRRLALPLLVQAILCATVGVLSLGGVRGLAGDLLFEGLSPASVDLLMATLLPGQILLAQTGYLTGRERFYEVSLLNVLSQAGYLAAVIVVSLLGRIDLGLAVSCFLGPIWIAALVGCIVVRREAVMAFSWRGLRDLLALGWRSQLAQVLELLQLRLDMFLLRFLSTSEQLGYYSVATNLSEWMLYLPRALQQVAIPRSARKVGMASRVYGWLFGILGAAALGVGLLSPWLVRVFFGANYLLAVPVLQVILPGTVLLGLGTFATGELYGRRETRFLSWSGLAVAVAFLLADLWALPRWGAFGAAAVSSVLYSIYAWALLRRLFGGVPGALRTCFTPTIPWRRPLA